jgi:colicin import membrane protein
VTEKSISFDSLINSISVEDLLIEDDLLSLESEQNQVEIYSSLIIQTIQSAWRKPINIQDGLICDLRLTINKNGRVIKANLIRSSGNIRFDNSALKAVQRVETFNFFSKIPLSVYSSNFKNIIVTFNPS